jgi:Flp pilus assembly protein TadD
MLMACCAWLMWRSACAGWSDFSALEAEYLVNSRAQANQAVDLATIERARSLLESALASNPDNGAAHQNLAILYQMRLALPWSDLVERDRYLNTGLAHARRAVALRPTSGYAYSVYAIAKQLRGERDAGFRLALSHAAKYGPWEPGVQNNIMDVGLLAWNTLDEPSREVVRQTIGRALQSQPENAKTFLQARRSLLPACGELKVRLAGICA